MSDNSTVTDDSQNDDITDDKEQVDSQDSDNASENDDSSKENKSENDLSDKELKDKSEKDLLIQKKEELDKRAYLGMIRKEAVRIAEEDDYTIDNVSESLRDDVIDYNKKLQQKISGEKKDDTEQMVQRIKEETKVEILLDQAKSYIEEEQQDEFIKEYEELKSKNYSPSEALDKAKKIYQVMSPEERERKNNIESMKTVSGGIQTSSDISDYDPSEHAKFNQQQVKIGLKEVTKEGYLAQKKMFS